jgi:hypothetical protein
MATETQAYEALRLAQTNEHRGSMASSARLCAKDAEALFNKGDFEHAYKRAVYSLKYSVGVFGEAYRKAVELAK